MLPIQIHGKSTQQIKLLEDSDAPSLHEFCTACKDLGYKNNESFQAIKLDKMKLPYGQFFIGLDKNKIFTLAGIHHLPELHPHAWRCLFRGAQLPGYTPEWSTNPFKSIIHISHLLYYQILLIKEIDPNAEFYISTNVNNDTGAKSFRMNKTIMPKIEKMGICNLHSKNIDLFNVRQNIWKIDVNEYIRQRSLYLQS